jgi:short-subunit dehydrogenase
MRNTVYTLITGASEGLGKALAFECASRGMNLVLVSLPNSGLSELSNFIRRNFKVSVYYFEKDLSQSSGCYDLFLEIEKGKLQINILINNAGMGSTVLFDEGSPEFYEKQIGLNVLATTIITHLFIKNLRGEIPSYILNVGSMASFFNLSKKQVYGGTKSYIYYFSKSLKNELKNKGISVSVICPGGINTNVSVTLLNKNAPWTSRISIMNAEDVALIALDGLLRKKGVIIPGRLNKIFLFLNKILPAGIKALMTNSAMKKLQPNKLFTSYLNRTVSIVKPAA